MARYVVCLGATGRRRAMARLLQRKGYDALACDGTRDLLRVIRERGLPHLILSESFDFVRRAREADRMLYEVGCLSFSEFLALRSEAGAMEALLEQSSNLRT